MVAVTPTVVYRGRLGRGGWRYILFEANNVDSDDTITLSDVYDITDVKTWRMDTGASITSTEASNVVTITQAGLVNVAILGCATTQ